MPLRNVPLPEAHLLGAASALVLHHLRPATLPGRRDVRVVVGSTLIAAAVIWIARSLTVAGQVDLERPGRLLTAGPYALSRNPMYVGWSVLHLGIGVVAGSAWTAASLPVAVMWIHREISHEERRLAARFGEEFAEYRAAVPRYLPAASPRPRPRPR